jgi:HTH DNA binding domain
MKRLVVETDVSQLVKFVGDSIRNVDFFDVLHFLKEEPEEIALICRVKFKDPAVNVMNLPWMAEDEVQILDKGKDGALTLYYRGEPNLESKKLWQSGGYLATPYEIRDGKIKLTFLGNNRQAKSFLSFLKKLEVVYKIDLLTEAKFGGDSPLRRLTEKQRRVLQTAFNLGYYDIPRRIGSDELARKLGIRNPTLVAHRRKAERLLMIEIFQESK